ncbi:hypothetical protein [Streptomyces virginiae]
MAAGTIAAIGTADAIADAQGQLALIWEPFPSGRQQSRQEQ